MKAKGLGASHYVKLEVPANLVDIEMESRAFQESPEIIEEVERVAKQSMADDGLWLEPGQLRTRLNYYWLTPSGKYYQTRWIVSYEW